MKHSKRYAKIVAWSEEDGCYVGRAPGLIDGGCHGDDERAVFDALVQIVEEAVALHEVDGKPLPQASSVLCSLFAPTQDPGSDVAGNDASGRVNKAIADKHTQIAHILVDGRAQIAYVLVISKGDTQMTYYIAPRGYVTSPINTTEFATTEDALAFATKPDYAGASAKVITMTSETTYVYMGEHYEIFEGRNPKALRAEASQQRAQQATRKPAITPHNLAYHMYNPKGRLYS